MAYGQLSSLSLTGIMKSSLLSARLLAACLSLLAFARSDGADHKPNVLFLVVDDLRPDLGCYGVKQVQSPNIDRLAARGMVFEHAYCQVAVCNASRSSLLAGARPDTTRIFDNQHFLRPQMPDVITLPQHFMNNGWHTVSLGKVFHHSEKEPGDDPKSWSEPSWYHSETYRSWFNPETLAEMNRKKKLPEKQRPKIIRGPPYEWSDEPDDSYPDGQTAQKAIETLQRLKTADQPFFLGVGFLKPHLPFTCPRKYWEMYPPETIKLPDNYFPPKNVPAPALHNDYELRTYGGVPATGDISDALALNLIRGYRACTTFVDVQIGRVLDELDRLGLRENTIVILWGDNGYHLGENGLFTKMTNFELGTHIPLILSVPGQKTAGQRSAALVEYVDVYPTLAELAGLPLPSHLEGTSFAPLLENPAQEWKNAVFSQYVRVGKEKFMGRSVRTDRWRYTEWKDMKDELVGTELYDEQDDPKENVNIAGEAENKSIVAEMAKRLRDGWKAALPASVKQDTPAAPVAAPSAVPAGPRADVVFGDFEGKDMGGWKVTGEGFQPKPFVPGDRFTAFEGKMLAWSGRGGPQSKGTLLSPEFEVQRAFINFLSAGARDLPANLGVELLVDGKVVRASSASEAKDPSKALYWRTWDVRDLAGRSAQIRVNDQSTAGWIAVDAFTQSDQPKNVPMDASRLGYESLRPQFHYTALTGWLNDANGLLFFQGQWHLFHQHRPPDYPRIVWGHAVSNDLLHWQRLGPAIKLDDGDSAASGSGFVDEQNISGLKRGDLPPLLLFYARHPSDIHSDKITQCLAFSTDGGHTFEQFAGNPLLRTPDSTDRDPKVFYYEPSHAWFMALSLSRNNEHREQATYGIFRSPDLKSWKLIQELGPGPWYWECPDLFPLAVDNDPGHTKWVFEKGSGDYMIGTFGDEGFKPETEPIRTQWGGSFYGAQTFTNAPGGRRVLIAWMSTAKDGPNSWPGMPFNQQMSFPRELTLRTTPEGPRLFREPIPEIAQLYAATHELAAQTLEPGRNALKGVSGDLLDLQMEIEPGNAAQVTLKLRGEKIVYDVKEKKLKMFGRPIAMEPVDGKLILRVLLDRTSIELFGNRGAVTFSGVFYPAGDNHQLALIVEGGPARVSKLTVHELRSIWPEEPTDSK
jgi:sucrose-6-phosphate hydrolase SacC (GH32 family)/arylsulfatase A-like enzyme